MHLRIKLHSESPSFWIVITWLNSFCDRKSPKTAQNWETFGQVTSAKGFKQYGNIRKRSVIFAFSESLTNNSDDKVFGQRNAPVKLEKWRKAASKYESKQEEWTVEVVEIQHVEIIRTADPVKGQSFLSRKCKKFKLLVSFQHFLIFQNSGIEIYNILKTPNFSCHSFII